MNKYFFRIVVLYLGLFFLPIPFSAGQDIPVATVVENEADSVNSYTIKVNVHEVRLDVVVVDGKGRPITDLTADDFEIYQDKLSQEVSSSVYINDQTQAVASPVASKNDAPNLLSHSIPGKPLKEEEVRRTIVFIVDDLSMTFEDMYFAKMGLKGFVEKQMQPGDMVSIMRAGYGNGLLDKFISDKRQLIARIDSLSSVGFAMETRIYGSQLKALSYGIRSLKDLPGRKIIFLMTSEPTIKNPFDNFTTLNEDGRSELTQNSDRPTMNYLEMYGSSYDRLADEALRAGVVVHLLDARGLFYRRDKPDNDDNDDNELISPWNPLPAKTGGIIVTDSNFFLDGIGKDANNMIAGYYLLSYIPPPNTFDRDVFRRLSVKVKRKGAVVHTREGFYSRTGSETYSDTPSANPLVDAIFAPFQYTDLDVNMTAGYIKGPKSVFILSPDADWYATPTKSDFPGYLLRAWIHLDPKDVKIIETDDGGAQIILETVCLTSDINGRMQDLRELKYEFNIEPGKKSENLVWIQKHGIRFTLLLPVKKPGAYTVHIAIRDTESGKVGFAYQFVEIPDLKKKGLELSSIFMLTSTDDLIWMSSDVTKELEKGVFSPIFQEGEVRSPALRNYASGDKLQTLTMLYNADKKAIARSEIETQSILYKNGKEFVRNEPRPITTTEAKTPDSISLLQELTIGSGMLPGDYVLQRIATDKNDSEMEEKGSGIFSKIIRTYLGEGINYNMKGVAYQTLSFTVKE